MYEAGNLVRACTPAGWPRAPRYSFSRLARSRGWYAAPVDAADAACRFPWARGGSAGSATRAEWLRRCGGSQAERDLSAEHAEEERRLQEIVRDRVWLIFHHFHDNAMGKFGTDARTLAANDFHEILEQSFYEEVARMLPTNSASPTQAEMEISSQIRYRVVFTHDCQ